MPLLTFSRFSEWCVTQNIIAEFSFLVFFPFVFLCFLLWSVMRRVCAILFYNEVVMFQLHHCMCIVDVDENSCDLL